MSQLDILYRALTDYRKNTREDKDCAVQRSAIISADNELDTIEVKRNKCKIETDWIDTIQRGLEFIEKAIKEERQFIRSNGEIIPIEKVKRVSKDSVEHLARHSNLLTREPPEGSDLIPDNLYTVERLSDFAVYENRFLYMVLCYLRDFISMRYERIVELTNTYNGKMSMNKTVVESNRRLEYKVELVEEKKNDDYLRTHNEAQEEISRILTIYNAVVYFLSTPLMNEVSKSPMLKPPITRTNVLRMNKNFREVMALYEYISAYNSDGFKVVTDVKTLSPFHGMLADEIVESVEMSSFITYEYGLGIKDYFKERYEIDEQKRKDEERRKYAEKVKTVKRHLDDGSINAEEYIVMLEKRISDLETVEDELDLARATIKEISSENKKLSLGLKRATSKIAILENEIEVMKKKHAEEIEAMRSDYELRLDYLIADYAQELEDVCLEYEQEIDDLVEEFGNETDRINAENKQKIEELHSDYAKEVARLHTEYARIINEWHYEYAMRIDYLTEDLSEEIEETQSFYARKLKDLDYEYRREIERIEDGQDARVQAVHDGYNVEIARLHNGYADLLGFVKAKFEQQIEFINAEHSQVVEEMNVAFATEKQQIIDDYTEQIDKLNKESEEAIVKLNAEHKAKLDDINLKHTEEVSNLNTSMQTLKEDSSHAIDLRDRIIDTERRKFEKEMENANIKIKITEMRVAQLTDECETLSNLKTLSDGRLNALRSEYGLIKENEDFTNRQMADELEHQYAVFRMFHKNQWQKTKKRIRAEVFAEVKAKEDKRLQEKQANKAKNGKNKE